MNGAEMYGARDPLRGDEKCVQNCSRNFERERISPKPMWRREESKSQGRKVKNEWSC